MNVPRMILIMAPAYHLPVLIMARRSVNIFQGHRSKYLTKPTFQCPKAASLTSLKTAKTCLGLEYESWMEKAMERYYARARRAEQIESHEIRPLVTSSQDRDSCRAQLNRSTVRLRPWYCRLAGTASWLFYVCSLFSAISQGPVHIKCPSVNVRKSLTYQIPPV